MRAYNREEGIMLISILILSSILLMMVTSMVLVSSQNYNLAGIADKKSKALKAAESGVEYALYELNRDTTWTPGADINIDMYFSEGESAKLVSSSFVNNLTGSSQVGSTPAFCAEVLSEGFCQGQKVKVRGIFTRDDIPVHPIVSDKNIFLGIEFLDSGGTITVKGKDNGPGRIHANGDVILSGSAYSNFDMNGGFASSGGGTGAMCMDPIPEKSYNGKSIPLKVPDINISNIINTNKGSCHPMPADKFFIVGYFEYQYVGPGDPNNYCVPHEGTEEISPAGAWIATLPDDRDKTSDDKVYEYPYKYGIASVTDTSGMNFMENYRQLQSIGPDVAPYETGATTDPRNTNPSRNLFDYYPDVTFAEIYSVEWSDTMDSLGMSSTVDTTGGLNVITLTLNEDVYSSGSLGLFETLNFSCSGPSGTIDNMYNATIVLRNKPKLKLNLNNHKIFADKYLGFPVVENTGTIISNDSVDVFLGYDANMVIVAKDNVALKIRDITPGVTTETTNTLTLNGLIYSKDNIMLDTLSWGMTSFNVYFNFNGSMTCMDTVFNNTYVYAGTGNWLFFGNPIWNTQEGLIFDASLLNDVLFEHSNYGVDTLAGLRGTDFHVRKWMTAIVN